YERTPGITPEDRAKAAADAKPIGGAEGVIGQVAGPLASSDGRALQVAAQIKMGSDGFNHVVKRVDAIHAITGSGTGGLTVRLAGPASYDRDSAKAFQGIDGTLLGAAVLVIIVILLFAYRSPVLWLLPIICAGIALT